LVGIVGVSILFYISYSAIPIFNAKIVDAKKSVVKIIKQDYHTSIGYRVALVHVGVEVFKEKPIFGWGIKDNFEAIKQITKQKEFRHLAFTYNVLNHHYHNQYIIYATQLGVLGLILFLLLFYYLSKTDAKNDELNKIKFILIVVIMISLLSTELFHQMHPIALFSLFSGLILAHNSRT
jgi:O-antigen ligase